MGGFVAPPCHAAHRDSTGTEPTAAWMCMPQPTHVGLPHLAHGTCRHMVVVVGVGGGRQAWSKGRGWRGRLWRGTGEIEYSRLVTESGDAHGRGTGTQALARKMTTSVQAQSLGQ